MRAKPASTVVALGCLLAVSGGVRAEWFADACTAFVHDDNVSHAQRDSDIRSDHALVAHASGGYYVQLTDRTGATLAASVRREQFSHYPPGEPACACTSGWTCARSCASSGGGPIARSRWSRAYPVPPSTSIAQRSLWAPTSRSRATLWSRSATPSAHTRGYR